MRHDSAAGATPVEFMGITLGPDTLETSAGSMPLRDITRAAFHRDFQSAGRGPEQTSTAAVVGGAAAGAVVFGPVGAVAGGLAGSTVKTEGEERLRQSSARLIFTTSELSYEAPVARADEGAAIRFAEAVEKAAKHAK